MAAARYEVVGNEIKRGATSIGEVYASGDARKIANEFNSLVDHIDMLHRDRRGETWMWQGDGDDYPYSITCPVIMRPEVLRDMLASQKRLEERIIELKKLQDSLEMTKRATDTMRRFSDDMERWAESHKPNNALGRAMPVEEEWRVPPGLTAYTPPIPGEVTQLRLPTRPGLVAELKGRAWRVPQLGREWTTSPSRQSAANHAAEHLRRTATVTIKSLGAEVHPSVEVSEKVNGAILRVDDRVAVVQLEGEHWIAWTNSQYGAADKSAVKLTERVGAWLMRSEG